MRGVREFGENGWETVDEGNGLMVWVLTGSRQMCFCTEDSLFDGCLLPSLPNVRV